MKDDFEEKHGCAHDSDYELKKIHFFGKDYTPEEYRELMEKAMQGSCDMQVELLKKAKKIENK